MKKSVKSVFNYKKPAFWIVVVAVLASMIAAVCFLTDPVTEDEGSEVSEENDVSKDLVEGSLLYDLGITSLDSIESCKILDDSTGMEISLGKEYFEVFAKYRYAEYCSWIDAAEIVAYPVSRPIDLCTTDGRKVKFYFIEDGRISINTSKGLKIYQAEGNTTERSEQLQGVLRNETKFIDEDGKEIYLKGYKNVDSINQWNAVYQKHTWVDFDSDGKSELVVYVMYSGTQIGEYLVFHVENNKVYCFEFGERGMQELKEDGTFIQSSGAGHNGWFSLRFKGSTYETLELAYKDISSTIEGIRKEFRIDGKQVTEEEIDAFFAGFSIKKPAAWEKNEKEVVFRINDSLPDYRATVTYNLENLRMGETLVISEKESGEQIQEIDLPENECFTEAPLYLLDVTFDGNLDILVPKEHPASAVYFQAYVWNEKESQFIYAPTFESLPNIALDTENKLILSSRTASQISSYAMSYYDNTKNDFIIKNSIHIESTDNQFETDSFWDLDSEKWHSYFLVDKNSFEVIAPNQLYTQFLNGEIAANDNGQEKFLKDYLTDYHLEEDGYYKYTFIDMTGDGTDELCIENIEMYFFTIEDGKLNHWRTEGNTYTDLLSNGAIFYERDGAAPEHIDYQYYELDENGSVAFKTTFSWYEATEWPEGPNKELIAYPDRYWVDDIEVTKEEYEEKTKEYMTLSKDRVTWNTGYIELQD